MEKTLYEPNRGVRYVDEIWKTIKEFEGLYEVSNLGQVRSLPRNNTKGKILKSHINKYNGYVYVGLCKNNIKYTRRVHCLVMQAFCPVNKKTGYDKYFTIDHKDGNKTNNCLDNLEWCTQSENQLRAYEIGINGKHSRKVINLDTFEVFESEIEAAKSVGGKKSTAIHRVCVGIRSNYRNAHFAFFEDYVNDRIPNFKGIFTKRSSRKLWQ